MKTIRNLAGAIATASLIHEKPIKWLSVGLGITGLCLGAKFVYGSTLAGVLSFGYLTTFVWLGVLVGTLLGGLMATIFEASRRGFAFTGS